MASKIIAVICLQVALFNAINAQCMNRIMPGLQGLPSNMLPMPVTETILPNQVLFSPNYPAAPVIDVPYQPYGVDLVQNQVLPATTIIQDSTVANNLANALQLLVVSNLLSNTLPSANDYIMPGYAAPLDYGMMSPGIISSGIISPAMSPCGYGPYNYIY